MDRIVRVRRHPLAAGVLLVLLTGVLLLGSVCHPTEASAQGAAGPPPHAATAADVPDGAAHPETHEHADGHHCADGGLLGADARTGPTVPFPLLVFGVLLAAVVWPAPPPVRGWLRPARRHLAARHGTRLLISLCVLRV